MIAPGTFRSRLSPTWAALDPATLLGRAHDGACRGDRNLAQPLIGNAAVLVVRVGERVRHFVVVAALVVDAAHRRDAVFQAHAAQRVVGAAAQDDAAALEARVLADFPAAAIDDDRRGAVVEAGLLEVPDFTVGREGATPEAFSFVERDLRRCMGGERDGGDAEKRFRVTCSWRVDCLMATAVGDDVHSTLARGDFVSDNVFPVCRTLPLGVKNRRASCRTATRPPSSRGCAAWRRRWRLERWNRSSPRAKQSAWACARCRAAASASPPQRCCSLPAGSPRAGSASARSSANGSSRRRRCRPRMPTSSPRSRAPKTWTASGSITSRRRPAARSACTRSMPPTPTRRRR